MPLKQIKDLKLNDELEMIYGQTVKRCFVASTPQIDGGIARFRIHPCCKRWYRSKLKFIKIAVNHSIEVFDSRLNRAVDPRRLWQQRILSVLTYRPQTLRQIKDKLKDIYGDRCGQQQLWIAMRGLRMTKKVVASCVVVSLDDFKRNSASTVMQFRLPLTNQTDVFVIEKQGSSERIGWIEDWKEHRATETIQPIVRFLQKDGSTVSQFSRDKLLQLLPKCDQFRTKQLEFARRRHEGVIDHPPIDIPIDVLRRLYEAANCTYWVDSYQAKGRDQKVLLEIAQILEFVPDCYKTWAVPNRDEAYQKTLDYLWQYYPGWRAGKFVA